MITIRFPLAKVEEWFMPIFLIFIGLFCIIPGLLPMVYAGILALGGGILWALTNLGYVRWNTD